MWQRRLTVAGHELRHGERSRTPSSTCGLWIRDRIMRAADVVFDRSLRTRPAATTLLDYFHPDHTVYEASGWTYLPRVLRPAR